MATTVYTQESVELQDGREVTLRPANIKVLRRFMKKMDELKNLGEEATEFDTMDIIIDAAAICLVKQAPELLDESTEKHTDEAEEVLDMETAYKVIEIVGGVKLNDPEALARAAEALRGQN